MSRAFVCSISLSAFSHTIGRVRVRCEKHFTALAFVALPNKGNENGNSKLAAFLQDSKRRKRTPATTRQLRKVRVAEIIGTEERKVTGRGVRESWKELGVRLLVCFARRGLYLKLNFRRISASGCSYQKVVVLLSCAVFRKEIVYRAKIASCLCSYVKTKVRRRSRLRGKKIKKRVRLRNPRCGFQILRLRAESG